MTVVAQSSITEPNRTEPNKTKMAKVESSTAQQKTVESSTIKWSELTPISVDFEDAMGPKRVAEVWQKMMIKAGVRSASEDTQRSFRLAVYVYGALNGTSREGNYKGEIKMSTGHAFDASVIPQSTGNLEIRQFFRGNMVESYHALKLSGAIAANERMVARAAALGISADCAFAMADWMASCPLFTNNEAKAHDAAFVYSVQRSRRARGGRNLEAVEGDRRESVLESQGPVEPMAPVGHSIF